MVRKNTVRMRSFGVYIQGVQLSRGNRYEVILKNGTKISGEYMGFDKDSECISIMPGMLHVFIPTADIDAVHELGAV